MKLSSLVLAFALLFICGCASTLDSTNKGANEVGKTGGKVIQVPHSATEGVAEGIAKEPEENPYNR